MRRGNCYVTSEALFHLLGGKAAGWSVKRVRTSNDVHWFLEHESGVRVDATAKQFSGTEKPNYSKAIRTGFLTKQPSKRAQKLMEELVWQK